MSEDLEQAVNNLSEISAPEKVGFAAFVEEITHLRWRALIFANFVTFGSYYVYDFPSSLGTSHHHSFEARFQKHGHDYTQEMNQALYSVYSWPNTVLAVFGGLLIDKFLGIRNASLLFVLLVAVGSFIVYLGVETTQYPLLLVGRFIFGLGGESLSVAQSAYVARWFKTSKAMALAFGITISFSRVGSSFNFLLSPRIAESLGVEFAALAGCFACGISIFATVGLYLLDVYGTRTGAVPAMSKDTNEKFHPRDLMKLPFPFWIVSLVCVCVYCSIFPFIGVGKNFVQVKYDMGSSEASTYVSVFQFVCAGGSPIIGFLVDNVGLFTFLLCFSNVGFAGIHALMAFAKPWPAFVMAYMGMVYSVLVSALWPLIPYCVEEGLVGFAYGVMTAMQNTGLAIFPLISGAVLDKYTPAKPYQSKLCKQWNNLVPDGNVTYYEVTYGPTSLIDCTNTTAAPLPTVEGYNRAELLFMSAALAGILFSILLIVYDHAKWQGLLSATPKRRKVIREERQSLLEEQAVSSKHAEYQEYVDEA